MTCFPADPNLLCLLTSLTLAREEPLPLHQYVSMKEDFQSSEPETGSSFCQEFMGLSVQLV